MLWLAGIGGVLGVFLYLSMFVLFGWRTVSNGHGLLFVAGFALPVFWLLGALIRPNPEIA